MKVRTHTSRGPSGWPLAHQTTNLNCSETYNYIILSSETSVLSTTHNRLASGSARPAKARATAASAFAQVTRYYQIWKTNKT
jgi:hypothetical protein